MCSLFKLAIYIASLYIFILNLIAIIFHYIVEDTLSKTVYIQAGVVGTITVVVSLGYVFRKRYLKKLSKMKVWLDLHVVTGSIGTVLILLHSEFHLRALLPSLTLIFMELVVASGVVGRYLISHITKQVSLEKMQVEKLRKDGFVQEEEDDLMVLVFSASIMKKWKMVHVQFTSVLTILTILHVISELYYRGFRL